jgi:hypothetical protein
MIDLICDNFSHILHTDIVCITGIFCVLCCADHVQDS